MKELDLFILILMLMLFIFDFIYLGGVIMLSYFLTKIISFISKGGKKNA